MIFIILCDSKEDAVLARNQARSVLLDRGLELSEEKIRIRNVEDGFDFLGYNIRSCLRNYNDIVKSRVVGKSYGNKLIIKRSKLAVRKYKKKIDILFKECRASSTFGLIRKLNPIIRGWVH